MPTLHRAQFRQACGNLNEPCAKTFATVGFQNEDVCEKRKRDVVS